MNFISFFNRKSSLFTIWDIKLSQLTAMCLILILTRIFPVLNRINIWVLVVVLILAAIRPCYVVFIKKSRTVES